MNSKLRIIFQAGIFILLLSLTAGALLLSRSERHSYPNPGFSLFFDPDTIAKQETEEEYAELRRLMVERQLRIRGISNPDVLAAMGTVPRHKFVPEALRKYSYIDNALPIDRGQTISQPFIVAMMTQLASVDSESVTLEIGTGSGYQAAVLGEITKSVYSIEIDCILADQARERLTETGYDYVTVKCGDGYEGWPEHAPFDAIIVTAAAPKLPEPLIDQLKTGGTMVIPVGQEGKIQILTVITKTKDGYYEDYIDLVRFVPMTGKVQEKKIKP